MRWYYFFYLLKIRKENVFPWKFQKFLKEPSFHFHKYVRHKNICDVVELHKNLEIHYKKGWFFHKIFDNSHLKFGKMKKAAAIKK